MLSKCKNSVTLKWNRQFMTTKKKLHFFASFKFFIFFFCPQFKYLINFYLFYHISFFLWLTFIFIFILIVHSKSLLCVIYYYIVVGIVGFCWGLITAFMDNFCCESNLFITFLFSHVFKQIHKSTRTRTKIKTHDNNNKNNNNTGHLQCF